MNRLSVSSERVFNLKYVNKIWDEYLRTVEPCEYLRRGEVYLLVGRGEAFCLRIGESYLCRGEAYLRRN